MHQQQYEHQTGHITMLYSFDHSQIKAGFAPEISNEYLMGQIKAGNEEALAELHRRHAPLLRSVVSRVMNNEADIDDLIQEIFVELWNRADSYSEQKGKALGWIVTLARRRAIDKLRKKQALVRAEERLQLEPVSWIHHGPDDDAGATDLASIFRRLLAQLPDAQREALQLTYYHGLSQREIAAKTGIPLGTIKTRLELALRKVRNAVIALGDFKDWRPAAERVQGRLPVFHNAF